jgi:PiT family inorganic phosphate transporter
MPSEQAVPRKTTLDKDLKKIARLEKATRAAGRRASKLGIGLLFLLIVMVYVAFSSGGIEGGMYVVVAGVIGGYMALNIGANDVANNMGPAVGAKALTLVGALVIASIFEAAGAVIAGSEVVKTISKGIIDADAMPDATTFIWAMLSALMAAAVWVNLATYLNAPVSTTHSIVGGVMGGGIAAASWSAVDWGVMAKIAASWVISPVLGGLVAALFLAAIKVLVIYKDDKIKASKTWVPVFVALMASVFSVYLVMKGLKHVWKPDVMTLTAIGAGAFVITVAVVRVYVSRAAVHLENRRKSVGKLFTIPLICSAAFLSFAHGANDVANAVGPLAAVVGAVETGSIQSQVTVPIWVLVVGAFGISAGLALFGPKLIRTVGEQITRLDPVRAFAVALSAAITVIVASGLGLPVSSTHIAIGAIFGVGFLREFLTNRRRGGVAALAISAAPAGSDPDLEAAARAKALKKARKRRLVRRTHFYTIIAAWLVTVPSSALIAAVVFFFIRGVMLP